MRFTPLGRTSILVTLPSSGANHVNGLTAAPDGSSTEVHVALVYEVPGGELAQAVAKYFGEEPHQQLDDDLRRLKQVLEGD